MESRNAQQAVEKTDRIVVLYDYGPDTEGARQAVEASVLCFPSLGGSLACAIQRSLYGGLAEASMAKLTGSLLQVVYDPDGYAEWVIFGSTVGELERANQMIEGAERGEADAALLVGWSLSEGANGFPIDSTQAYKWLCIAALGGSKEALTERDRIGKRLSLETRESIEREVRYWATESRP